MPKDPCANEISREDQIGKAIDLLHILKSLGVLSNSGDKPSMLSLAENDLARLQKYVDLCDDGDGKFLKWNEEQDYDFSMSEITFIETTCSDAADSLNRRINTLVEDFSEYRRIYKD